MNTSLHPDQVPHNLHHTASSRTKLVRRWAIALSERWRIWCGVAVVAGQLLSGCASFQDQQTYSCGAAADDGRFTIGTGNQRLMYGYPVPRSTSHFVVQVDGEFASNNPCVGVGKAQYIYGSTRQWAQEGSPFMEIQYEFKGVQITQRLIPVDKDFKDVPEGSFGQYYRIEYTCKNISGSDRKVGLLLLVDTMIDNNDAAKMEADGTKISSETTLMKDRVPSRVLVYRTEGNKGDLTGEFVTDKGKAVKPDAIYIGRWRYFYSVIWNLQTEESPYFDSGVLMRWSEQTLANDAERTVATHYGVFGNNAQIKFVSNNPSLQKMQSTIYYEFGKDNLSDSAKTTIDNLLAGKSNVEGVFVEVYTDAVGTEENNLKLAKRRADNVITYLTSKNIRKEIIIQKAFGEAFADKTAETIKGGKREDRKAEIIIYTKSAN